MLPLILSGAGALLRFKGALDEAAAERRAAYFNAAEEERLAARNRYLAGLAVERGEHERETYIRGFQQEQGQRTAAMGASGINLNSGTSVDVLADNAAMAQMDADMIRWNADLEAWQLKEAAGDNVVRAGLYRSQGNYALRAGRLNALNSILSGAGSMAGLALS